MSSETITTALFLITAVVASAVLINAVYPVIANMAGTFSSTTHESDARIRTDFKIIATYASESSGTGQVWMKNVGSEQISLRDVQRGDVFGGATGSFDHLTHTSGTLGSNQWTETFTSPEYDLNGNQYWDSGETVKVTFKTIIPPTGNKVYFQFALPNGIWRSTEFTVS
jgi:archaeal flagellar protein FlaG